MALHNLKEYMSAKGKVIDKAPEKVVAGDVEGEVNDNDKNPKHKNVEKKGKSGVLQVKENVDMVVAHQIFRSAREVASQNPKFMERLVREFKESGTLACLVAELLEHKETYKFIAELMSNKVYGEQISKNLARAMISEDVSAPMINPDGDNDFSDDDDGMDTDTLSNADKDHDEEEMINHDGDDDDDDDFNFDDLNDDDDDMGMGDDDMGDMSGGDDNMGMDDPSMGQDPNSGIGMGQHSPMMGMMGMPKKKKPFSPAFENFRKAVGNIYGE